MLQRLSYAETDVFLLVFCVISKTSFDNILEYKKELDEVKPGTPIVLCGSKIDLREEEALIRRFKDNFDIVNIKFYLL